MRVKFNTVLLIAAFVISLAIPSTFAQEVDSVIVAALPPGNLNTVINGDTTSTGERVNPNRVYVLAPTGVVDTTYFITAQIEIKDLTLVGKINPNTGHPPVIAPFILEDNTSAGNIAAAVDQGFVKFENLFLLGTRTDGSQVTQQCVSANSDSCRYVMKNCIFENFGSSGTPNILNTWDAIGTDIFLEHCLFRNNQSSTPQNPGVNWAGPGVNAIDTFVVRFCTFEVMGGNIAGSGSSINYFEFDHNTMFNHTKSSPFSMVQQSNSVITNNIFYNCYSAGLDSNHIYNAEVYNSNFYSPPAIFTLDTLTSELLGDPYYYTEAGRIIYAENNAYYWNSIITDNFDVLNGDTKYQNVGGRIYAPVWAATKPGVEDMLTDSEKYPGIQIMDNNWNVDPGFDATFANAASDSMAEYVRFVWENGGSGLGSRPFINSTDPIDPFADVPDDWESTQGYPVKENLRYTNSTLLTADSKGRPIGDLTWYPELITGIKDISDGTVPTEFSLDQNYPNPFNPTTKISYSIASNAHVTLKVFNVLGQEVATLVNKEQQPGKYVVDFNAAKLASGVYMYRIEADNTFMTKKMILLK